MRRTLTGLTAAVLAVLAVPVPAQAASVTVRPVLMQTTLAPGDDGESPFVYGLLNRADPGPFDVEFTVDWTAVAGFARLRYDPDSIVVIAGDDAEPDPCRPGGTVITCRVTGLRPLSGRMVFLGAFSARPVTGAVAGDSGKVLVTVSVDGGPATSTKGIVQIGEPVDIAGGGEKQVSAPAGGVTTLRPQVRNAGTRAVRGAVLALVDRRWFPGTFRNCLYSDTIACTFTEVLRPGRTYEVSVPIPVRVPTGLAGGSKADYLGMWMTRSGAEDWGWARGGTPGTGGPLHLVEVPGAAAVPQKDVEFRNNNLPTTLTVTGIRPDVAAVGTTLTGAPGTTVTAGLRNDGPGTLRPDLFGNNTFTVEVTMPTGVTVTRADKRCYDADSGRTFVCYSRTALPPGQADLFTFAARIGSGKHDGGRVTLGPAFGDPLEYGKDTTNNTAAIRVAAPSGAGGGLPVSGPGGAAGLAVLLLAGGAGALLLTRRRRIRFTR